MKKVTIKLGQRDQKVIIEKQVEKFAEEQPEEVSDISDPETSEDCKEEEIEVPPPMKNEKETEQPKEQPKENSGDVEGDKPSENKFKKHSRDWAEVVASDLTEDEKIKQLYKQCGCPIEMIEGLVNRSVDYIRAVLFGEKKADKKEERERFTENIGRDFDVLKGGKILSGKICGVTTNRKGDAYYMVRYDGSKKRNAIKATNKKLILK